MKTPRSDNPTVKLRHANWQAQGALVRSAMEEAGLMQKELAQAIGVPPSSMSEMLRGMRGIDPSQVRELAKKLGKSVDELIPSGDPTGTVRDRKNSSLQAVNPGKQGAASENDGVPDIDHLTGPGAATAEGPPELEGFLGRNTEKEKITRRETWYLRRNSKFRLEAWVVQDDRFWLDQLRFWREYLRRQDQASGAEVRKPDPG